MDGFHPRVDSCSSKSGPSVQQLAETSDFQTKYWAHLFGNLERSIDQLYQSCEACENLLQCKEVILALDSYGHDFQSLAEWLRVKWEYENTPPPQKPNYVAWEIRRPWKMYSSYQKCQENYMRSPNNVGKNMEIPNGKTGVEGPPGRSDGEPVECGGVEGYDVIQYPHPIVVDPITGNHLYQTSHAGTNVGAAVYIPPEAYPEVYVQRTFFENHQGYGLMENNFVGKKPEMYNTGKLPYPSFSEKQNSFPISASTVESIGVNQNQLDPGRSEGYGKNIISRNQKKTLHAPYNICGQRKRTKQCSKTNCKSSVVIKKPELYSQEMKPVSCDIHKNLATTIDCIEDAFTITFINCGNGKLKKKVNLKHENSKSSTNSAVAKLDAVEAKNAKILSDCFQTDKDGPHKFGISVNKSTQTTMDVSSFKGSVSKDLSETDTVFCCKREFGSSGGDSLHELNSLEQNESVDTLQDDKIHNVEYSSRDANCGNMNITCIKVPESDNMGYEYKNEKATDPNMLELEKTEVKVNQQIQVGQNLPIQEEKPSFKVSPCVKRVNSSPCDTLSDINFQDSNSTNEKVSNTSNMKWDEFQLVSDRKTKSYNEDSYFGKTVVEETYRNTCNWKNIEPNNQRDRSECNNSNFPFLLTESERLLHFPALGATTFKKYKASTQIHSVGISNSVIDDCNPIPECVKENTSHLINFAKVVGSVSIKKQCEISKVTEDDLKEKPRVPYRPRRRTLIQEATESNASLRLHSSELNSDGSQSVKECEQRDKDGWEKVKAKPRWKDESFPHFKRDMKNLSLTTYSSTFKTKLNGKQLDLGKSINSNSFHPSQLQSKMPLQGACKTNKNQSRQLSRNQKTQIQTHQCRDQRNRTHISHHTINQDQRMQDLLFDDGLYPKDRSHAEGYECENTVEMENIGKGQLKLNLSSKNCQESHNHNENKITKKELYDKTTFTETSNLRRNSGGTISNDLKGVTTCSSLNDDTSENLSESIFVVSEKRIMDSQNYTNQNLVIEKKEKEDSDDALNEEHCNLFGTSCSIGLLKNQTDIIRDISNFYNFEEDECSRNKEYQNQDHKFNSQDGRTDLDLEELRINEEEIRKSNELHEEELMLTRKIQDLESADFDENGDTETDETDIDFEGEQSVIVDPSQIHQAYNQYMQSIPWSDQIDEMEKLANIIGTNRDTVYEPASLEHFKELVARHPRRALELHVKLSSRSKREGSEEKNLARRIKADEKRQQLLSDKAAKMRELVQKVEEVKAQQDLLAKERKYRLDLKLKKAEENRNQHLSTIRRKAHDEEEKLKEIAFINELEAQNRRHESMALRQEQEERLQNIIEERQRKVGEKAAKEAAVEERRRVLEAERQEKLEKMQEKRRKKEEIIGRKQKEKEMERLVIARDKAREREERLQARQAAQLATAEELQKKIQLKQEKSARRHEENIELIRQKALETGMLRSIFNEDDSGHSGPIKYISSEDTKKEIKFKEVEIEKGKGVQRKRTKKLRSRMSSRGAEFLLTYDFKNLLDSADSGLSILEPLKELDCISNQNPGCWENADTASQLDRCLNDVKEILEKKIASELTAFREYRGFCMISKFIGYNEETEKDKSIQISVRCFTKVCSLFSLACKDHFENSKYVIFSNNIVLLCDSLRYKLNNFFSGSKISNIGNLLYALQSVLQPSASMKLEKSELGMKLNDFVSYVVCSGLISRISDLIHYVSVNDDDNFFELSVAALEFLTALTKLKVKSVEYLDVLRATDLMGTISLLYGVLQARPKRLPLFSSSALQFLLAVASLDITLFQEILGAEGVSLQFRHTAKFLLQFCSKQEELEDVLHAIIQIIGFFAVHNRNNQEILVSGNLPTVISQLLGLPFRYYSEPLLHHILFPTLIACCYDNETNNAIVRVEMNVTLLDDFLESGEARESKIIQLFLDGKDGMLRN